MQYHYSQGLKHEYHKSVSHIYAGEIQFSTLLQKTYINLILKTYSQKKLNMERSYAQLKNEGFSYLTFIRLINNRLPICFLLFRKLSQSELYMLYYSFSVYFHDPQCKDRPDYAAVSNAFMMLQRQIERKIRSKLARDVRSRFCRIFLLISMLAFIGNVVSYIIFYMHDDTIINTIAFCYCFFQTLLYRNMISNSICLRIDFPSLNIHRNSNTNTLGRLCRWFYERVWYQYHLQHCYYCRIFNMKQVCKIKKLRPAQDKEQEEPMKRRQRRAVLEENDGVWEEETRKKKNLKEEKKQHLVREANIQMTILYPADHNSINESLVES